MLGARRLLRISVFITQQIAAGRLFGTFLSGLAFPARWGTSLSCWHNSFSNCNLSCCLETSGIVKMILHIAHRRAKLMLTSYSRYFQNTFSSKCYMRVQLYGSIFNGGTKPKHSPNSPHSHVIKPFCSAILRAFLFKSDDENSITQNFQCPSHQLHFESTKSFNKLLKCSDWQANII